LQRCGGEEGKLKGRCAGQPNTKHEGDMPVPILPTWPVAASPCRASTASSTLRTVSVSATRHAYLVPFPAHRVTGQSIVNRHSKIVNRLRSGRNQSVFYRHFTVFDRPAPPFRGCGASGGRARPAASPTALCGILILPELLEPQNNQQQPMEGPEKGIRASAGADGRGSFFFKNRFARCAREFK
jgi:hypothetical protein